MKILLLADEESKYYWDYFEKSKLEGIDLIISCGDLAPQFLSFMATFAKVPGTVEGDVLVYISPFDPFV